jgi:hypothetical protein
VKSQLARAAAFVFLLAACCVCRAGGLSLPLDGYFHPGRAMPVRWEGSQSIELSAPGAITTRVESSDQSHGIFPWIATDLNVANTSIGTLPPLHPLDESDVLLAIVGQGDSDGSTLFPGRKIVTIHLQPDEFQGPPMAWETVDGLIFSPQAWKTIPESTRDGFFAEGVQLAVTGESRPNTALPWKRVANRWIASPASSLPPIFCPDAYGPTEGWTIGKSAVLRRQIFLSGALYCLIVSGVAIWRSRWTPAGFVAISIIAGTVFARENARQSPISRRSGIVRLNDDPPLEDLWLYQLSDRPADFRVSVEGSVHPVFFDVSQVESMRLILDCDTAGSPVALEGSLSADGPFALMQRRLTTKSVAGATTTMITSPLRRLARQSIYPQWTITGQSKEPTDPGTWPSIELSR